VRLFRKTMSCLELVVRICYRWIIQRNRGVELLKTHGQNQSRHLVYEKLICNDILF
jgi:hypothetical protein